MATPLSPFTGGGWTAQRLEVRPWACCSSSAPVPSSLYPFQPSSACGRTSHLPEKPSCPLGWPHVQKMNQFLLCAPNTVSVGRQVLRCTRTHACTRTHTHAHVHTTPRACPGPGPQASSRCSLSVSCTLDKSLPLGTQISHLCNRVTCILPHGAAIRTTH